MSGACDLSSTRSRSAWSAYLGTAREVLGQIAEQTGRPRSRVDVDALSRAVLRERSGLERAMASEHDLTKLWSGSSALEPIGERPSDGRSGRAWDAAAQIIVRRDVVLAPLTLAFGGSDGRRGYRGVEIFTQRQLRAALEAVGTTRAMVEAERIRQQGSSAWDLGAVLNAEPIYTRSFGAAPWASPVGLELWSSAAAAFRLAASRYGSAATEEICSVARSTPGLRRSRDIEQGLVGKLTAYRIFCDAVALSAPVPVGPTVWRVTSADLGVLGEVARRSSSIRPSGLSN